LHKWSSSSFYTTRTNQYKNPKINGRAVFYFLHRFWNRYPFTKLPSASGCNCCADKIAGVKTGKLKKKKSCFHIMAENLNYLQNLFKLSSARENPNSTRHSI